MAPLTGQTLFTNAKLADGRLVDLHVEGGRFSAIAPAGAEPAVAATDLAGQLVVPAFVEGHIHLDTSFYGDAWRPHIPCSNGFDVRERVAFQARNLAAAAPMDERARNQLELCLGQGSLSMRSHVMVDASVGLKHIETILAVRENYRELIDIQLVAFPQSGILSSPGTAELLDEALKLGCDLIGGLDPASFDRDVKGHLDIVFGLAERHGVGVDIHLHDGGSSGLSQIEEICARTSALGMQGRVAVSHAYALGDISAGALARAGETLAAAGVAIMTNAPGNHAFPPVAALRQAGVTVFGGSDNIRDSWWPYGDGDMLNRANMIGYRSGFYEDRELEAAYDVVSHAGARALGLDSYGIAIILFTIVIYSLFFPLKWRSSKSMKKAQKLAPKMKELQEKIKGMKQSDPRLKELQMEQLRLMREGNPLGGCLPLLIQMPFLFALYRAITISLDFRQASFLWIPDLSAAEPYMIHMLPILMTGTMVVLQLVTPAPSADPVQRKMMAVGMPLFMLYILWSAPSGLVLYWLVGNIIGFAQQFLINHWTKSENDKVESPPAKKPPSRKKQVDSATAGT